MVSEKNEEIKEKVFDTIIRPYHKNSNVTKMRVEDAIDLTIQLKDKQIKELEKEIEDLKRFMSRNTVGRPYHQMQLEKLIIEINQLKQKLIALKHGVGVNEEI